MSNGNSPIKPIDGELLLSRYLDGELDTAELAQLQQWLREDPAHIELLVKRTIDHHRTAELARARTTAAVVELTEDDLTDADPSDGSSAMDFVIDQALAERRKHDLEDEANRKLAAQQAEDARNRRFEMRPNAEPEPVKRVVVIPKALIWLGLAAVLGLIAWVGWPEANSTPPAEAPTADRAEPIDRQTAPQPVYVARVNDTYNAVWANGPTQGRLAQGTPATLLQGYAELVFEDGARVVIQAPAVIEPIGPNAMRLASGVLTAQVPESAHGFEVHTPQMLVTDLGTAFGVEVAVADQVTEAFVFEGLIEVSTDTASGGNTTPNVIPLTQGQGARGVQGRAIVSQTVNPGRFIREVETAPYAIETSDTACFLETPPRSLLPGVLENNDWLHVVLEQTGVRPTETFKASFTEPGRYQSFAGDGGWIEIGQPVDSYLVHLDPVGNTQSVIVEGSITFPRPVVALFGDESQLIDSDRWFARPGVRLFRNLQLPFGLDGASDTGVATDQLDMIELSEDRRTIRFRLHALRPFDEFRILIEAAEVSP